MLPEATDRILALPDDALVLDVGGWAAPFNRATHVIDAMPFESRGAMGFSYGGAQERFGADTWTRTDFCAREPWPFADDTFDLVLCVTTLEDVRDPIWVCQEMSRVAKAGYLEVPSILNELTWRLPGEGAYVGNRHHHWFCRTTSAAGRPGNALGAAEVGREGPARVEFVHKQHGVHADPTIRVTPSMAVELGLHDQLQGLFWEGRVEATERLLIGETLHDELRAAVDARFPASGPERVLRDLERRIGARAVAAATPLRRAAGTRLRALRGGRVPDGATVSEDHVRPGLGRPRD
ncbi:class I SAM-dependent methyltransferase [Patulibacter minatonensis]|uniref:class I SAM-dependent methyltransferase n=1 Tax=Patulibacter minatonensis TaxID=298163 RepID=UPI00047C802C|nr:methyltransferase domain-containing protein [Patulibacter minatonensis]